MKSTAIVTAMIALFVAIGMTGSAMAAPAPSTTMHYDVDFSGTGTGSMYINTVTPVGSDYQNAQWTNCDATGHQDGRYNNGPWLKINRDTRLTGINGQTAFGSIFTKTTANPSGPTTYLPYIYTVATYYDNVAGGSYVMLDQKSSVFDNGGMEKAKAITEIDGYAYGDALTGVSGRVTSVTDGQSNAATSIYAGVHDGSLDMDVTSNIKDNPANREESKTQYTVHINDAQSRADGGVSGYAAIDGVPTTTMNTIYMNVDDLDVVGHFYAVTP